MAPIVFVSIVFAILVMTVLAKTAIVVPQQSEFVIERLGQFSRVLRAGFHILIPFIDRIAYKFSVKEEALDVPEQICITSDNVQVGVDGIIYLKIFDAKLAAYGINDYVFAVSQLTQTNLRSEIGKLELDRTFEARTAVNAAVVSEVDKASETWGVKILRYEIKNIVPPPEVIAAMEKQMRAEREKRASILQSEGERDSRINSAEGEKQRVIKESEAQKERQVNEAEGEATAILSVAEATAEGIKKIAAAIQAQGGEAAMQLRIAEQYIGEFGKIAKASNTVVLPANLTDLGSVVTLAKNLFNSTNSK